MLPQLPRAPAGHKRSCSPAEESHDPAYSLFLCRSCGYDNFSLQRYLHEKMQAEQLVELLQGQVRALYRKLHEADVRLFNVVSP